MPERYGGSGGYGRDLGRNTERLSFGPFVLSISERLLLRDGVPVQIGSRSLDVLIALARTPGQVVEKLELIRQIWNGLAIDEGALRVHVNGLRKALRDGQDGARYIINVPGRGYSIVTPVSRIPERFQNAGDMANLQSADLPPLPHGMIGRGYEVQSLMTRLRRFRFVSLVGPGGIGKTTIAITALHRMQADFDGGIYFVNLSAVTEPRVVYSTIASMLDVGSGVGDVLSELLGFLRRSRCLLVLDSCEHLIEPVATLADAIRKQAPLAFLLTTTREPLRVEASTSCACLRWNARQAA